MQPGQRIAQYEIQAKLGSGGMGVVYSAYDTRLDRMVALKFLPPGWGQDEQAKTRFLREAQAASGLDHPHIYTIYEIGETEDGSLFIVTPLYDGQTLKYRLMDGPLSIPEARRILVQLLEALAVAHEAGIIHRDIKPANIMVTNSGDVKLLDFGLAKLTAMLDLTQEGTTLGTAAYMSPEQARGKEVDNRADLWSAGVVLYEMLTGVRPFQGDYEQAVIYSVLNDVPTSVASLRHDVPRDLQALLVHLLSKDPADRPATAREARESLGSPDSSVQVPTLMQMSGRRVAILSFTVLVIFAGLVWLVTRGGGADQQSESADAVEKRKSAIAIMPFSNLGNDPQTDFLGYALADQIIGSLSYVKELLVRPSSSIRQYVDRTYSTRSAGDELAVDYLLNGTYQRQDDDMRLTIELVDVSSDQIIWREPVELEYKNAFQIQDAVSEKVLRRLQIEFSEDERRRMTFDVPSDPLAYDYYLQAISSPETREGNRRAVGMLDRALQIDSTYAPAWNHLGFRWQRIGQYELGGQDFIEKSEAAFLKALEINPGLLSALGNLSTLYTDLGRTLEGIRLADRILEVNPFSSVGHFARGYAFRYAGLTQESVREMTIAINLDSTDTRFRSAGISFVVAGDLDAAEKAFRIDAGTYYAESWLAEVAARRGNRAAALKGFEKISREDSGRLLGLWAAGIKSAMRGDYESGLEAARAWDTTHIFDAEARYYNAALYCINRDLDACIRMLEGAVRSGYFNLDSLLKDRFLEAVQGDPRFDAIVKLARDKQEAFKESYYR